MEVCPLQSWSTCHQSWGDTRRYAILQYSLAVKSDLTTVISGGHFKATLHKVSEPPTDQQHEQRLSLVFFNGSKGNMRLKPMTGEWIIRAESGSLRLTSRRISTDTTGRIRVEARDIHAIQEVDGRRRSSK